MEKTINFTSEELKAMRTLVRMELEEETRSLKGLSRCPANIKRIHYLEDKIKTLQATLDKINEQ